MYVRPFFALDLQLNLERYLADLRT